MKKICSKCGKTIEYNTTCTCRTGITYNRNILTEKRKFYSSYSWQKLRNRKVKEHASSKFEMYYSHYLEAFIEGVNIFNELIAGVLIRKSDTRYVPFA